jgi:peptide/nickel transport system ATP-binding protein
MRTVLEIKNLRIEAPGPENKGLQIVKGVNLIINKGEVHALIGESGSGKTTIALASLAYCKPGLKFSGGEVLLNNNNLLTMNTQEIRKIRGRRVAYLAQSAAATFNPALTIGEQVTESAILHGILSKKEAGGRALELYRALELPDPERIGFRYPHQVSGGQLQRLMAAMALCSKPDLLVLDEPTTALDVTTQIEVLKAFKKVIREEEAAAIYVTHDLAVVAQIADQVTVLYKGRVQEQGPIDVIINNPTHEYTRRLMDAVVHPPVEGQGNKPADQKTVNTILEIKNVTAGYGHGLVMKREPKHKVLHNVNMMVKQAHVVGIVGESGCGKSTLAKVIAGLLPAVSGEIFLDGEILDPMLRKRTLEQLRRVQIIFQMADTALNPRQRIKDIIGRPLDFYLGLRGKKKQDRVAELLDMVELPQEFASRFPAELSGGQKQRINLARALAAGPTVLLCDEVTSSLDSIVGAHVVELLKVLREKTGVSFVYISHDLSTVASFADELVVLYAGSIVEQGTINRVLSPPFHPYTRLLISSIPELHVGWLEKIIQSQDMATGIGITVENRANGCAFFKRCPLVITGTCDRESVPTRTYQDNHLIACHHIL